MYSMEMENLMFERVEKDTRMTDEQMRKLLSRHPELSYLVFAEDRTFPIHMVDGMPERWKDRLPAAPFAGQAQPGELYTFQLCVYAGRLDVNKISLEYTDLVSDSGESIPSSAFHCFNLGGIDSFGKPFTKEVSAPVGRLQTLWIGIYIPEDAKRITYHGEITLKAEELKSTKIKISIEVAGEVLKDGGVGEPWRHSRLQWLDSTIAIDDEITAPYIPLKVEGSTVKFLGRQLSFGNMGLPESIKSFLNDRVDEIVEDGREILAAPIRFIVEDLNGEVQLESSPARITSQSDGKVTWESQATDGNLTVDCRGWVEYDGFIGYRISVKSSRPTLVKDIRVEFPYRWDVSVYAMGLGHKGGYRPAGFDWKWDRTLNQDTLWMGDINAGLMVRLLGPEYEKPHMLFYYVQKPLNLPKGWNNEGKGGCTLREEGSDQVVFCAYSGERTIEPGQEVHFDFDLMATPVKPIDKNEHWNMRYYHKVPESMDEVAKAGANVINVHHGNEISPYINYPFIEHEPLADFVKECHEHGYKAKLYYTVKEITVRMTEFWALRSLGNEVFADGNGVGFHKPMPPADEWMKKYIGTNFIPAWKSILGRGKYKGAMEASVVVNPMSRYNNYFLEDIKWIMDHTGIDGLYFDDVAFDRTIMRRVRKVLDRHHPGCMIDLHSWNYFKNNNVDDSRLAGWGNSVNLYIDNFPYIDRMWFGEGFDYDETPDFWLIEMSGIPFGMMGEMLQNGGNLWRGMVYGMTTRMPMVDVTSMWKLWDDFGILNAKMLGFWNPACPVKTSHDQVLATAYVNEGKTLVSIASWADGPVECTLNIDWEALGLDPQKTKLTVPAIDNFQDEQNFSLSKPIPIEKGKGWLLLLSQEA